MKLEIICKSNPKKSIGIGFSQFIQMNKKDRGFSPKECFKLQRGISKKASLPN